MTKLINLHQAWLKNLDYKEAYEAMQIEFDIERQYLSLNSTTSNSKWPIQSHDSQIQLCRNTHPH